MLLEEYRAASVKWFIPRALGINALYKKLYADLKDDYKALAEL